MRAQHPAFQLRIARERQGEVWIQFDGALIKLLALFQFCRVLDRRRKDPAPPRKPGRPRRFRLASASSAISPRSIAWLAAHLQFPARDRSGSRKRRSHRDRNPWPRYAHRCWHRLIARSCAPCFPSGAHFPREYWKPRAPCRFHEGSSAGLGIASPTCAKSP